MQIRGKKKGRREQQGPASDDKRFLEMLDGRCTRPELWRGGVHFFECGAERRVSAQRGNPGAHTDVLETHKSDNAHR